jgi:deoxyribose-phosphate aldolase
MGDPRALLALRCLDLTSLNDDDTEDRIEELCRRGLEPATGVPPVAGACVLLPFVRLVHERLPGSGVRVVCATGGFPRGAATPEERTRQIRAAIDEGADEIDTPLDHAAFVAGRDGDVVAQLDASRRACGSATMKVILESGALPTLAAVRRAGTLAVRAGADFLKTSSGKGVPGATPEAVLTIAETVRSLGTPTGIKVSGGIRSAADAIGYMDIVTRLLGDAWATPDRFRIGASSVLDDLVAEATED